MLEKAWTRFQSSGRSLPYAPRSLAVHTNAQICAHPTPRPQSAHVSRIAANSIPHYCCAVHHLYSFSQPSTPSASATYPSPLALTCRPLWVRQPTLHLEPLQDKQAKGYIRGPASWHSPSSSHTIRDRHSSRYSTHQTTPWFLELRVRWVLKAGDGIPAPSAKNHVTLRTPTSTCTNSNR